MVVSPYTTSSPTPFNKVSARAQKTQSQRPTASQLSLSQTTPLQSAPNQEPAQSETQLLSLSTAPAVNTVATSTQSEAPLLSLSTAPVLNKETISTQTEASLTSPEDTAGASLSSTPAANSVNADWQADTDYRTRVLGQTWSDQGWRDKNGNLGINQNATNDDGSVNYYYKQYGQDWRNRFANGQTYDYSQGAYQDADGNQIYRTDVLANRADLSGNAEDQGVSTSGNTNNISKEQYEAAQAADTLWNYFQALGTPMPRWWDRAALYEELTGKPALEYVGDGDQNTELLRLLQARNQQLSGGAGQGKAGVTKEDVYRLISEEFQKSGLTRRRRQSTKKTATKRSPVKKTTKKSANQQVDKGMSGVAPTATANSRAFGPREKQKPSIRGKRLSREPVLPTGGYIN